MNSRIARARGQAGFTLVELLVVIAILGILSGVVVFAVRGIGDRGRGVAVATDERILRTAEESYCAQNGRYGAEYELVRDGFLTGMSEYHAIAVGDDPNDPLVFDQTYSTGNCGETFKHYQIACRDGSPMPDCGTSSGPSTSTSTTVPPNITWVPLSQGPTSRLGAAMVEYPPMGAVVMFGGRGTFPVHNPGETWLWTGSWAVASAGPIGCEQDPPPVTQAPCPRVGHSMAYDAARGMVVMVGGVFDEDGLVKAHRMLSETWTWRDLTWTQAAETPTGRSPQSVFGAMAYDATRRKVVLFGGRAEDEQGNERDTDATWVWNGPQAGWHRELVPGPSPRQGASMAYDPVAKRVILFGGVSRNVDTGEVRLLADTWSWDGQGWAELAPTGDKPSPRAFASMATMPATSGSGGGVVLFGGEVSQVPSDDPLASSMPVGGGNDTWEWSRNIWTKREPKARPPGRALAPLAYHEPTSQMVMFGGNIGIGTTGSPETWGYRSTATPSTTIP